MDRILSRPGTSVCDEAYRIWAPGHRRCDTRGSWSPDILQSKGLAGPGLVCTGSPAVAREIQGKASSCELITLAAARTALITHPACAAPRGVEIRDRFVARSRCSGLP